MSIYSHSHKSIEQIREAIDLTLESLKSQRHVRKVVTRSGARARGLFPTLKSPGRRANFESGLEELVLCVCEVATSVKRINTHPYVLEFPEHKIHYTPDMEIETKHGLVIIEVKGDIYLRTPAQQNRFRTIHQSLFKKGIPFAVILSTDIRDTPLAELVRSVLKNRPQPVFGTRGFLPERYPGLDETLCSPEFLESWESAGRECDDLLSRLMNRGPDETLAAAA